MKKLSLSILASILALFLILVSAPAAQAQSENTLELRLSRVIGYSSGSGKIQGTFTLRATGPDNLARVVFYLDEEVLGEATEDPFGIRFVTDNYGVGLHTLSAVGYTTDGAELTSNEIRANFVSPDEGWQAGLRIAGPILALTLIVMLISFAGPLIQFRRKQGLTPLGAPRSYGAAGGTICPKCQRPFSMHFFAPNVILGKFDFCPHCGKWSVVRRHSMAELRAAEEAELEMAQGEEQVSTLSEEEKLRKELEKSRFQDL